MRKILNKKGFTLVEMLVAMSIFVVFVGILLNSYTSIVRSQRDANDYRVMYAEARHVFDSVIAEFREGMVDYSKIAPVTEDEVHVISKDGRGVEISFEEGEGIVKIGDVVLNNDVRVTKFDISYHPPVDPYSSDHVYEDGNQFHPMVTIDASFEKEKVNGEMYEVDFKTSVSSRIYNQVTPRNES